jgi:hypothetical protein
MSRHVVWVVCVLGVVLGLGGCGGDDMGTREWPSEEVRTMRDGAAPTPFTAAQIREACPPGRRSTYRIEIPGRPVFLQTFHFLESDEEGCDIEMIRTNLEGISLAEPSTSRSTWEELQSHASWPKNATTIRVADVEVPAGPFPEASLYIVERTAGGKATVTQSYFARELPGPPVKMVQLVDGETLMTMTLVEHLPGGP